MILAGVSFIVCTLALLIGAFTAVPDAEVGTQCATSTPAVGSEMLQTFQIFVLGFLSSLAVKRRHSLGKQIDRILRLASDTMSSVCSAVASMTSAFACVRRRMLGFCRPTWMSKDVMVIAMAGIVCFACIAGLLVSAFTVEPDVEPGQDGLASESSTTMRVFTVGWMFLLTFKLRRELVGVVGDCYLLQPW
jgi:hypothetical protein